MATALFAVGVGDTPLVIGGLLAFAGGLLSFVSPCVLPLVPGYLGYLAGTSVNPGESPTRRGLLSHGLAFVLGFATVFTVFGVAVGLFLTNVQAAQGYVRWIGGVVIIILGLHMTGLVKIPFLNRTVKMNAQLPTIGGGRQMTSGGMRVLSTRTAPIAGIGGMGQPALATMERAAPAPAAVLSTPASLLNLGRSYLVGVFFAAGWSPCVGPILTGIYGVVGSQPTNGGILLFLYSLGLGVPFMLVALLFGQARGLLKRINRHYGIISLVSGIFLIAIGILLFTDSFARLSQFAPAISIPGVT